MVKLYFQTCSTDGEEKGTSGGGSYPPSSFKSFGGSGYSPSPATASAPSPRKPPSKSKTGLVSSSSVTGGNDPSSTASNVPGSGLCSGMGVSAMGTRGSNSVFLEGGAAAGGGTSTGAEEALPMGVASVLWELECCVGQARITLMNLIEGRPNHFGVFRAGVYVEEIRMLEAKVSACVLRCFGGAMRSSVFKALVEVFGPARLRVPMVVYVCVIACMYELVEVLYMFNKLYIIAQSGPVILSIAILHHSHWFSQG